MGYWIRYIDLRLIVYIEIRKDENIKKMSIDRIDDYLWENQRIKDDFDLEGRTYIKRR